MKRFAAHDFEDLLQVGGFFPPFFLAEQTFLFLLAVAVCDTCV
jgi:hypothetical protein